MREEAGDASYVKCMAYSTGRHDSKVLQRMAIHKPDFREEAINKSVATLPGKRDASETVRLLAQRRMRGAYASTGSIGVQLNVHALLT